MVRFVDIGGHPGSETLEIPCGSSSAKQVELGLVKSWDRRHIYLHRGLISEILKGPDHARKLGCGHGDYYKTALATLLHEASHLYDARTDASDKTDFLQPAGWDFDFSRKNQLLALDRGAGSRSPDAYEYSNPKESFAVNMEYFLLDPEYRCRRPSLWRHFAHEFGMENAPSEVDCKKFQAIQVDGESGTVRLDPKRIYQVQYLIAEPGSDLMSRWGHSMLRLIVCDPKRKEPGPDCLKDVNYHLVVSYRANLNDTKISTWSGIAGKYPSQLYFLRMNSLLEEYGRRELRDLRAYPLRMNEVQKARLTDFLREQYWGYQGKYKFLSNNCATEVRFAIKQAYQDPAITDWLGKGIIFPHALKTLLFQSGLLEEGDSGDEKKLIQEGYFYPSKQREELEKAFDSVRSMMPAKYGSVDEYLKSATASERARVMITHAQDLKKNPRLALSMYVLELQFSRLYGKKLNQKLAQLSERNETDVIRNAVKLERKELPWNRLKPGAGYGVPSENEIDRCASIQADAQFKELNEQIQDVLSVTDPLLQEEGRAIQENLKALARYFSFLGVRG
jgi:hypothetical protein